MFHVFRYFLFVLSILKPSFAKLRISDLKNCKEESHESRICLTGKDGYFKPFPVFVDSQLILRNIIGIDENEKSISLQLQLWTRWDDPGVALLDTSLA